MKEEYFSHLTSEEKKVLIDKGTEAPFSGKYNNFFDAGIFICRACKAPLYESNTKFNSGCGWPSFDDEISGSIKRYDDFSGGRIRTEICCAKCDGHLGHVFVGEKITLNDTRHCVNSLSIQFKSYNNLERVTFGAGNFWKIENIFKNKSGIYMTSVGFMGGDIENPTYDEVSRGDTNHIEVVDIFFDSSVITFDELLKIFWFNHDPTSLNRQVDVEGSKYSSVIFYYTKKQKDYSEKAIILEEKKRKNQIITKLEPAKIFYRAEEYHQNYLVKNNLGNYSL
ncbi:MAG: bifunctional methionine sulfoxide reductase B/A protein [Flavobacteriales bacterium]|nr:bifunctional methionine sulfoxide reductase B/A protein [Flavobacteriales bacterium]